MTEQEKELYFAKERLEELLQEVSAFIGKHTANILNDQLHSNKRYKQSWIHSEVQTNPPLLLPKHSSSCATNGSNVLQILKVWRQKISEQ